MTPVLSFLKRAAERYLGKYYEGPEPPDRLAEMVVVFANTFPLATRSDWVRFATEHAGECYRSGYTRGLEYTERDPELWRPDVSPEQQATQLDPDWAWSPAVQLTEDPGEVVRDAVDPDMQRLRDLKATLSAALGKARWPGKS